MFEGDDISSSGRSGFVGRKRELAEIVAGLEDARGIARCAVEFE